MAVFLILRQNEDLTNSVPLLESRQPKNVFRQNTDNISTFLVLEFFVNNVVYPSIDGFIDKGNSINVEQK
jgi:hypothetical protein